MSNKSTATPENALSQAEIDEYLNRRILARMATQRADGYPHLTPIWFVWENGTFLHTLGAGRVHLANLARDPRMSLVIDEDYRLAEGLAAGARSITVRGDAQLSQDPDLVLDVTYKALVKYLGEDDAKIYTEPIMAEGRTIVTMTPTAWVTWDYNKGD
jgi:PPOX class probable F420-dependent enzyme